jgi:hypothetical protein
MAWRGHKGANDIDRGLLHLFGRSRQRRKVRVQHALLFANHSPEVVGDVGGRQEGKWAGSIVSNVSNTVERRLYGDVFSLLSTSHFPDGVVAKVCARGKAKV